MYVYNSRVNESQASMDYKRQCIKGGNHLMRVRNRKLILLFAIVLCVIFLQQTLVYGVSQSSEGNIDTEYLTSVINMISNKYRGEIDGKKLMEGALKGMLSTLDAYTTYFDSEETDEFYNDMEGSFEGIGVTLEKRSEYVVVIKVFSASPAEKAGIIPGDRIISVNGKSIVGASVEEATSLIKGKAGTKVDLEILRGEKNEVLKFKVYREKIEISPVEYEIKNGICYLKIESFNANTDKYVTRALEEADKENVTKIILDLRNNPGGEVGQAVAVAGKFVPKGLITKLDFKSEDIMDLEYVSELEEQKYKVAVLVNGLSASASEIVAGAIQDTGTGVLIGTKTFGKAKVQSIIPILTPEASRKYETKLGVRVVDGYDLMVKYGIFPQDDEIMGTMKITTGVYSTPKGKMIDEVGLTPDIIVDDPELVNGIDINSLQKLSVTWKPDLNDNGIDIYYAEKILKALGYDVDTPDTFLDEKTYQAISKFRTDKKLYPGGVLDFTTQKALNAEIENLILKYDRQYAKAVEVLNEK